MCMCHRPTSYEYVLAFVLGACLCSVSSKTSAVSQNNARFAESRIICYQGAANDGELSKIETTLTRQYQTQHATQQKIELSKRAANDSDDAPNHLDESMNRTTVASTVISDDPITETRMNLSTIPSTSSTSTTAMNLPTPSTSTTATTPFTATTATTLSTTPPTSTTVATSSSNQVSITSKPTLSSHQSSVKPAPSSPKNQSTKIVAETVNASNPYCKHVCHTGGRHTLCKYSHSTKTFDEVISIMGEEMRATILSTHNTFRNKFASGRVARTLPLAANMREMNWNMELEKTARMWAKQCENGSDACRDSVLENGDFPTYVSQLRHFGTPKGKVYPSFREIFESWKKQMEFFHPDLIHSYRDPANLDRDYSDFAQLIWADTYYVGCAMVLCKKPGVENMFTVCNYGPGGKREGFSVYIKGGPCTYCRKIRNSSIGGMYCSLEYIFLCSRADKDGPKLTKLLLLHPLFMVTVYQTIKSIYLQYPAVQSFLEE